MTIAFLFLLQIVATNWSRSPAAARASRCRCRCGASTYQNWPFYYSLAGAARAVAADELADPADEVRHGPRGHARGRGQGGDGRRRHAGLQAARLRRQRRVRRHGGRDLRLLPRVRGPDRDVQHPAQRPDPALDAARRARDAVRAGARRVPDRAAERVVQQPPRRRQRAAADLRRADGAGRDVPAARDHPDAARPARGLAHARQGGARRRAAGAARAGRRRCRAGAERRAAARGRGPGEALRRAAGGRRRVVRRARGLDHGADRPQRLGQDDRRST